MESLNRKKLWVGNLNFSTTIKSLRSFFEKYGRVKSAEIILNHETNLSKGFGFVEMSSEAEAQNALDASGKVIDGRELIVNYAKPKAEKEGRV